MPPAALEATERIASCEAGMTGAMLSFAACFVLKPPLMLDVPLISLAPLKGRWVMLNKENLTKEISDLDMLIGAVSNEIAVQKLSSVLGEPAGELLKEMQEALSELRLARGVRLMLLNAFEADPRHQAARSQHAARNHQAARSAYCRALRRAS
jgi:hypothetical protein